MKFSIAASQPQPNILALFQRRENLRIRIAKSLALFGGQRGICRTHSGGNIMSAKNPAPVMSSSLASQRFYMTEHSLPEPDSKFKANVPEMQRKYHRIN